ncbi:MAG: hypothetical protein ACREBK_06615 [Sphingomicrobium sp.]
MTASKPTATAAPSSGPEQLDYVLRRAEQESIAAIRSPDPRAARQHEAMSFAYSARALSLLGDFSSATAADARYRA